MTGNALEVNTDTGSIAITDPSSKITGSLTFESPNVWVADGSILSQLESNPNYTGRDTALSTNSGTSNPLGFVSAGGINALVTNTFFVQNS